MSRDNIIVRLGFILLSLGAARLAQPIPSPLWSAALGLIIGVGVVLLELYLRTRPITTVIGGLVGLLAGLTAAALIGLLISFQPGLPAAVRAYLVLALALTLGYLGMTRGATGDRWWELLTKPAKGVAGGDSRPMNLVLDTSVIIDGRIADIAETGFLSERLIIPQFILRELQHVADSPEATKRNRGRRGLDILQRLQKNKKLDTIITDMDFPNIREVDLKLIELAKQLDAKIVTNDFNLNKVAQLRGVLVLNINELANALRPVFLPGETMQVFILKEGKEYNQGVAYLDDGTMVVVDNARRFIGRAVDISVTSVLQTTAGKMIFGKLVEEVRPVGERTLGDRSERPERLRTTPPTSVAPLPTTTPTAGTPAVPASSELPQT
ncbi:MAG: TRAM domain-containing protein [Chloracidobacterium sp.]|nr:TRAM domain-containing protein [Chloracidobacterium sp.]MDW8216479.1 TRAM domain-containing protein [Acidobacteriota bacterium]